MKTWIYIICYFAVSNITIGQEKLNVFFDFNKSELNSKALQSIDSLFKVTEKFTVLRIKGFCDVVDSNKYNDSLSKERARKVFLQLKKYPNINLDAVETLGLGANNIFNSIEKNRRVEIEYEQDMLQDTLQLEHEIAKAKVGDKIVLKNLNFYNMSNELLPESRPVMIELITVLNKYPNLKIQIQGHICCQIDEEKNFNVSLERAKMVYFILQKNKIAKERLSFKSFEGKNPIYPIPENNEEEREANRRVEIQIVDN
jgi:outer membrane protein OmpA-like peptidoglycan-associated protein